MAGRLVLAALLLTVALAACGRTTPPPPNTASASQVETITGRERIGWDQQVPNPSDAARYRYAIYVDGVRSELTDVACGPPVGGALICTGRLPGMSGGAHTLELATFTQNGSESARSAPLRVMVQPATSSRSTTATPGPASVDATADGTPVMVERLAEGLHEPVDLAVVPDGRVLVAERSGRLHIVAPDRRRARTEADVDDGEMLAVAADEEFRRTRLVYALYAAPSGAGATYRIARYREVDGKFGERAVLVNAVAPVAQQPAGTLRTLPDGHLLVAVSTAASGAGRARGMLLRYARDGTTPKDQDGATLATGLVEPRAAWDAARQVAWVVDGAAGGYRLSQLPVPSHRSPRPFITAPFSEPPGAIAVYDNDLLRGFSGDLLVGSPARDGLLRVRVAPRAGTLTATSEEILHGSLGPVLGVAVAPDGTIYFVTSDILGRILPVSGPGISSR